MMHTVKLRKLLRDITDKDASKRRAAAEGLSGGDDRAIYPLIKALRDDNLGVQDAAMRSLMEIKGESTAYMVLPLLRENSYLRNTAIMIIREMGKIAVPLLRILLNDRDDDVRKFALDLIHDIQHCGYPEKLVELLTGDPNANVRAAAAKTIGILKYKKAIPQLIKALSDEEWVCFSALEALTYLNDASTTTAVINLLNNPSETIRFAAIEALGRISSPEAVKYLTEHISATEGFEKITTIKSLARIGSVPSLPGVAETLIDMLKEDEWEEKLIAIRGLVSLKAVDAIYHMADLAGSFDISDPESEDKLHILKDSIISFGCHPSLIDLLSDDSIKYRAKVVVTEIVGKLKCRNSVTALINLLNSDYRDVRRTSIKSLGEINSDEARQCLIDAISDDDSHVRKTAITALGNICEMTAFEPLMKTLRNEKYNDVIDEFIRALMKINSSLLMSRLNEFDDNIRRIAAGYASEFSSEIQC